jgi:CheY-like chemotaxis protein
MPKILNRFLCVAPNLYGYNILIVEDEIFSLLILRKILDNTYARILTARNGKEALKILKEHKNIDLIFMDMVMPVMDGYEATQIIKKEYSEIPVIAVSIFSLKNGIQKALDAGCDSCILKPPKKREVYQILRKFLKYPK